MKLPSLVCNLLLTLSALFATPVAMAKQCGDVSPLFDKLGDQYYELQSVSKSDLQADSIHGNKLVQSLQADTFKSGKGIRTQCFGVSQPREVVREFVLDPIDTAQVNGFKEVVLKAYEYEADTKTGHRETLFIPLSQTHLSLNGDNGFVSNKRHRQANGSQLPGSHLREISITAVSTRKGVEIQQSVYINGHLAEWVTWYLES
ncbi:MAG: hypothetical protein AB8B79_06775 [Granulosicoccus sp.]